MLIGFEIHGVQQLVEIQRSDHVHEKRKEGFFHSFLRILTY